LHKHWLDGYEDVLRCSDAELLDEIEAGDKVDFDFIETRDKPCVITDIEAQ